MKTSITLFTVALCLPFQFVTTALAQSEAFEIGTHNVKELPGGKEADGIIGDFVLRNYKIEAVISANLHLRRANMSTFYGDNGITPGCLYDLTRRGMNNDQIVVFTPSGQQGMVSYVRVVGDGRKGEAAIETVVTAANNNGLYKRHEYRVRDGWQGLLITTTFRNEGTTARKGSVADRWTRFDKSGTFAGINWADAINPAHKAGYAYAWWTNDGLKVPPREVDLKPGEEVTFARFVAVGNSPADAVGAVATHSQPTATVRATVSQANGQPITTAKLEFISGKQSVAAYPDAIGRFSFAIPRGNYTWKLSDIGRPARTGAVMVGEKGILLQWNDQPPAAGVAFDIADANGKSIPCKVQFHGVAPTKNPNLGPNSRAHGCVDQYHSETGKFRVQLDPGEYDIIVTRGIEHSHLKQRIKLGEGKTVNFTGTLKRLVDTRGWVSADYHNHSTPSGDNVCDTDGRLINLAAEHIEFAPTTEHNRFYDWTPHIKALGLDQEIKTVSGVEATGSGAHFNSFPFEPQPFRQDNGLPPWNKDPRITAATLRHLQKDEPARWIQINHPDMVANFTDRDGDGRLDGGFAGLAQLIDGVETENYGMSSILEGTPYHVALYRGRETVRYHREFVWLQLLNQGTPFVGMAVCDSHTVYGNGVGGWRMYMPSKSDNPSEIDWKENSRHAKEGRSYLTTGPFLQVETSDGILPGGTTRAQGSIDLKIKVQCTDWIDIDRVQVLVNGRARRELNFTRASHAKWFNDKVVKFDRTINVPLSEDAHLIVVAIGENFNLKTGYGTSGQAGIKPIAYHNPIFVDVDGGGFKPNGDTLGFPLTAKGISTEQAKKTLELHKLRGGE